MQTFAEQLSAMRRERRITQEQLAKELNVSRTTISRWESGKVLPDIETIKQLSQVLDYNFFTVEGMTDAADPEAPAEPEAPVRKRGRGWLYAVGGLCLLAVCVLLLVGVGRKPSGAADPVEKPAAQIVVTPSTEVAYLEPSGQGVGWYVSFTIENLSDVPFSPSGLEAGFFENEKNVAVLADSAADLLKMLDGGSLVKGGKTLNIPYSANLLNLTHIVCCIFGTDDNGNPVEVSATIRLSSELAVMQGKKEAALQAMAENPDAACIVVATDREVSYLEPFSETSYGWNSVFYFQNFSDVAFKPDGLEATFYENDIVCMQIPIPYEDIQYHMSNGKLYKGGIPLQYPVGSSNLNHTHVTLRIFGTDDNGNPVDESATVRFSQEMLGASNEP